MYLNIILHSSEKFSFENMFISLNTFSDVVCFSGGLENKMAECKRHIYPKKRENMTQVRKQDQEEAP